MSSVGWCAVRYHIAERSPALQPTKQRNVFTEALRQVCRQVHVDQLKGERRFGWPVRVL